MMKYVKSLHYATCYEICLYAIKENDLFAQNMMSFLHLQKYKTSPRFPIFVELLKIFDSIKKSPNSKLSSLFCIKTINLKL